MLCVICFVKDNLIGYDGSCSHLMKWHSEKFSLRIGSRTKYPWLSKMDSQLLTLSIHPCLYAELSQFVFKNIRNKRMFLKTNELSISQFAYYVFLCRYAAMETHHLQRRNTLASRC